MKIGEVNGNLNNKLLKSISSSGKTLFLDFKKQLQFNDLENTELEAFIKYNRPVSACQNCLDVEKNTLIFPKHSSNTNCTWLITSNFGSYIILNFKFIEVNSKTRVIFVNFRNCIKFLFY